ncbi:MAG: MarR family winged helix-turn-helix transcriptional regulator [Corynebacterium sp.]|nr:MarR family winged helix-turn-helix transcriptional regulator [Corynebacterium sp.]
MASPRWLTDEEQQFWRLLIRSDNAFHKSINDTLTEKHGLSSTEFAVLANLSEAEPDTIRLRDICTRLSWDRSRASHQISRMVKRGLITKHKCPGDLRGVVLNITYEGQRSVEAAAPDHVENVRNLVFDHMSEEEMVVLRKFFTHMMDAAGYEGPTDYSDVGEEN